MVLLVVAIPARLQDPERRIKTQSRIDRTPLAIRIRRARMDLSRTNHPRSLSYLGEGSIIRAEERLELGQLSVGVDDCRMEVEQGAGALGRPTPESAFGTHPEAIEHR